MKWLDTVLNKKDTPVERVEDFSELEAACTSFGPEGTRLFDVDYYLEQVSDAGLTRETAFAHYVTEGWRQGYNPSAQFDGEFYRKVHADVRSADINPLKHYVSHGHAERRAMSRVKTAATSSDPSPDMAIVEPVAQGPERRFYPSDNARAAFDDSHFRRQYVFIGGELSAEDAANPKDVYFNTAAARRISPNAMFDELWYFSEYPDIKGAIAAGDVASGFCHFCDAGWYEGRLPSAHWLMVAGARQKASPDDEASAAKMIEDDSEALAFMNAFPFVRAYDFVRYVGVPTRTIQLKGTNTRALMAASFDPAFYRAEAEAKGIDVGDDAFDHYFTTGARQGLSPNPHFDEGFYLAFYKDIRAAVEENLLLCGYEHFMLSGRREGRLPKHDLQKVLEASIPGVTEPSLLTRMRDIEHRLADPRVVVDAEAKKTFWIVLPRLDPDIAFGGYRALFELVVALRKHDSLADFSFRCLLTEVNSANPDYFVFRTTRKHIADAFRDMDCQCFDPRRAITVSPGDLFLAYSSWDAHLAAKLAAHTDGPRFIQLVQEYEAIFHQFDAYHAIINEGFALPAFRVFNSKLLLDFFKSQKLGPFAGTGKAKTGAKAAPKADKDYVSFEHIATKVPRQSAVDMAGREVRTCMVYARPEGHAARNLFEILLMALRKACKQGVFEGKWRFVGVGALSEMDDIVLTEDHTLEIVTKLSEDAYAQLLDSVDIGVSLMYAPHPSVVPFELCATGALVVVNTFINRDEDFFLSKSRNFVPGEATVDGLVKALGEAVGRVDHYEAREADALKIESASWTETFNDALLTKILDGVRV